MYDFDQIRVSQAITNGSYGLHLFKKTNDNREDNIRIKVVLQCSYAPSSSPVYLKIWNGTTLSWETLDTVSDKDADTDFSLYADVPTNESNYYDFGNQIAVLVYQLNDSGSAQTISIDQVVISFIARYEAQFSSVKTAYEGVFDDIPVNYVDAFPSTGSPEYTKKFPSKNPQDDL